MSSNLARDKATEAELLHLLFPDGIGNLSVEAFRAYLQEFIVFYKALLSEHGVNDAQELHRQLFPNGLVDVTGEEHSKRIRQYLDAVKSSGLPTSLPSSLLVAGDFNYGDMHEQAPLEPLMPLMFRTRDHCGVQSETMLGMGSPFGNWDRAFYPEKKSD